MQRLSTTLWAMTYTFSTVFRGLGPFNTPSCVWDSLSYVSVVFPGGSGVKNQPASTEASGDISSILGWGRCPGEENGTLLWYGQRNLVGYSIFDCKESDTTMRLSMHTCLMCQCLQTCSSSLPCRQKHACSISQAAMAQGVDLVFNQRDAAM